MGARKLETLVGIFVVLGIAAIIFLASATSSARPMTGC